MKTLKNTFKSKELIPITIIEIIIGASITYITSNLIYIVFTLILLFLSYYAISLKVKNDELSKENNDYKQIGLGTVHFFNENKIEFKDYEVDSSSNFFYWGISAKRIVDDVDLINKIIEVGKKNKEIKFLLLMPNCENLIEKAKKENDDPAIWSDVINNSIKILKAISLKHHIDISIKVVDDFPNWRIVFLGDKLMYLTYYLNGRRGVESPLIKIVDDNNDNLYRPFIQEFNQIWNFKAKTV